MTARAVIALIALYGLGALVFTAPMPAQISTHIWGDRFDAWTTMWLVEHLYITIRDGHWSAHTDSILFPIGYNLWSFGHIGVQLIGVPMRALGLGLTPTYNLLLLMAFTATGVSAHALGRHISGRHSGGFLAGVLFAFNPYLYGEMSAGCVELVAAMLLPLYALSLVRLCEEPSPRRAIIAGLVLAAIGPMNWYYTAFAAIFTGMFWLWRAMAGGARRPGSLVWIAVACALGASLNAPLIPMVRQETPTRTQISAETFSSTGWELSARISDGTLDIGSLDQAALERNDAMQVAVNSTSLINLSRAGFPANPLESTPGRLAFAMGAFGLAVAGRRGFGWAGIALAFTVLTLGPFVQLDATPPLPDWSATFPLPYYLLYNHLPFFSKAYRPYRLGVITLLAICALVATGWAALRGRRWDALAAAVALLAVTQPHWSGQSQRPLGDARIPAFYASLAELPDGALVELPLQYQPVTPANARFQYSQVLHGKPMLNCNQLIRRTDLARFRDYVQHNSFLTFTLDLARRDPPYRLVWSDLGALHEQGFRYVIAHNEVEQEQAHLAGAHDAADRLRQPAWDLLHKALGEPVLVGEGGELAWAVPSEVPEGELLETGETWRTLPLPWAELKLPITLRPDVSPGPIPLPEGARRLSLWGLLPRDTPPEGQVLLGDGETERPLPLKVGRWVRVELSLPEGTQAITLRPDSGTVTLVLSAVQVEVLP